MAEPCDALSRTVLALRPEPAAQDLAVADTPFGRLVVNCDASATRLGLTLDGHEVAALSGPGVLRRPSSAEPVRLYLAGEPAEVSWDTVRPGAWARPRTLTVRAHPHAWSLTAVGPVRELRPEAHPNGVALVRLTTSEGAQHTLEWSDGATVRDVVLAELLVVGHHYRAFVSPLTAGWADDRE